MIPGDVNVRGPGCLHKIFSSRVASKYLVLPSVFLCLCLFCCAFFLPRTEGQTWGLRVSKTTTLCTAYGVKAGT